MTTTLKKAAEALALAAPAAVEAEMLPGDAERMVDAVLRAIREPTQGQLFTLGLLSGAGPQPRATYVEAWQALIDSIAEDAA